MCSRDLGRAEAFAREHSGATRTGKLRSVRPYADIEEMVADPAVEMVYVASLNVAHVEATKKALTAGKPVLCEKPMALSSREAAELAEIARSEGVFLMEGLWTRHLPAVQAAKQLIDAGAIGTVREIEATLHADRDYDPRSRLFDPAQGGGALHDLGVYPLSLVVQYLGKPETVSGSWWRNPSGTDGGANITLAGGGITGRVGCSFAAGPNRVVIRGDGGSLVLDGTLHAKTLLQYPKGIEPPSPPEAIASKLKEWWATSAGEVSRRSFPYEGNGLRFQAVRMAECIQSGALECPEAPLDDTIAVLNVIDRVLETDPVNEPERV